MGALGLWLYLVRVRGATDVRYIDLALPTHWSRVRVALGDHYINEAKTFALHGNPERALHLLHVGIARSPHNASGRLLLAQIYAANSRFDLAGDTLEQGLAPLADDSDYVRKALRYFLEQQEDARLLAICVRLLATEHAIANAREVALFAATAAYERNDFTSAEKFIATYHLRDHPEAILLEAHMDWESGDPDKALARIDTLLATQSPSSTGPAYRLAYKITTTLDRHTVAEHYVRAQIAREPHSPSLRIDLLHLLHKRRAPAALERELAAYFQNFGGNPSALLQLAEFATVAGRADLIERIQNLCPANQGLDDRLALMLAESHLSAGEPRACLELLQRNQIKSPAGSQPSTGPQAGLQVVALTALGRIDEARLHLDHLLADKQIPSSALIAIARRLLELQASEFARLTLTRAAALDPRNAAALIQLVQMEIETGLTTDLAAHLRSLLATRKPPRDMLVLAQTYLGSDRQLFSPEQPALLASLGTALRLPGRTNN